MRWLEKRKKLKWLKKEKNEMVRKRKHFQWLDKENI